MEQNAERRNLETWPLNEQNRGCFWSSKSAPLLATGSRLRKCRIGKVTEFLSVCRKLSLGRGGGWGVGGVLNSQQNLLIYEHQKKTLMSLEVHFINCSYANVAQTDVHFMFGIILLTAVTLFPLSLINLFFSFLLYVLLLKLHHLDNKTKVISIDFTLIKSWTESMGAQL